MVINTFIWLLLNVFCNKYGINLNIYGKQILSMVEARKSGKGTFDLSMGPS
jgi:hypothetical protein